MNEPSARVALYRFYGTDDLLLYVGISQHLGQRWEAHMRSKLWWPAVRRQTVQWYASRAEAAVAESVAIAQERPLYNLQQATPPRRQGGVGAALDALDQATTALARVRSLVETVALASAEPAEDATNLRPAAVDIDKLIADLITAVGSERVRLSTLPGRLRQVDPEYGPYRTLKGVHIADALRMRGIRVTNTGNVPRVDPDDLRYEAS